MKESKCTKSQTYHLRNDPFYWLSLRILDRGREEERFAFCGGFSEEGARGDERSIGRPEGTGFAGECASLFDQKQIVNATRRWSHETETSPSATLQTEGG